MAVADIPLPQPAGPGGPFVASARAWNALRSDQLENQIKKVQAQYAPMTVPAKAMSEMAYASLLGPQFMAKMMGNQDIVANLPGGDPQRQAIINMITNAASGQGAAGNQLRQNVMGQNIPGQVAAQKSNPFTS